MPAPRVVTSIEALQELFRMLRSRAGAGRSRFRPEQITQIWISHRKSKYYGDTVKDHAVANDALKRLTAGVRDGKVRLSGRLNGVGRPAPIDRAKLLRARSIEIFGDLVDVSTEYGPRVYRDLRWNLNDVLALAPKLPRASEEKTREEVRAVYRDVKPPPNINKLPQLVRTRLNERGLDASKAFIVKIGEEPEFKALRRPGGKTLASERR